MTHSSQRSEPKKSSPSIRAWLPRVGLVSSGVLVVLVLGVFWNLSGVRSRIEQRHAEFDKTNPHWRFDDAVREAARIPDAENGAHFLLQVVAKMPVPHELKKEDQELFKGLADESVLNAPQRAVLREWLERQGPTLRELEGLWKYERGVFPVTIDPLPFFSNSKSDEILKLIYVLENQALIQGDDFNVDGAMRTGLLLLHLGKMTAPPGPTQGRVSARFAALRTFRRALNQGEPSEEMLLNVENAIRKEWEHDIAKESIGVLLGTIGQIYAHLEKGTYDEDWIINRLKIGTHAARRLVYSRQRDYLDQLEFVESVTKILEGPSHEQFAKFEALEKNHRQPMWSLFRVFFHISYGPLLTPLSASCLENVAQKEGLLVALAAERYRKKHDRWPVDIETIVEGKLLSRIPVSPTSGGPIWIRPHERGITIVVPEKVGSSFRDHECKLWNPDARHQAD